MGFIHLWKLDKRINSTLLPKMEDRLYTGVVALKAPTSVDEPIFVLSLSQEDIEKAITANYAMYGGQYYWITNITHISNTHIEVDCKIDVLATYKEYIKSTKAYVAYSGSHGNVQTVDPRLMVRNDLLCSTVEVSTADVFVVNPDLIIEVTNNIGSTFNTPYLLTGTESEILKDALVSPDFLNHFKQWFTNPMEGVIRAQYTTCNVGNLNNFGVFEDVYIGDYLLGGNVKGHRFDPRKVIQSYKTLTIPWHSSDFRKRKPYTIITLYLPYVGVVTLDSSMLYNSTTISIEIIIEVLTGNIIYNIISENPDHEKANVLLATYSACCNSSSPIAQVTQVNPIDLTIGAAFTAAGLTAEIPMVTATGMKLGLDGFQQHTHINGTMSSMLGSRMSQYIYLNVWTQKFDAEPTSMRETLGLPFYSTVELSTISGYCQCINASVAAPAMESEIREINNFLNGGVYLE